MPASTGRCGIPERRIERLAEDVPTVVGTTTDSRFLFHKSRFLHFETFQPNPARKFYLLLVW
ncbi:hypothetical protein SAMN05216332_105151 [Nitrosospira briensis]|nr:hypothetical protein SAMN05216332_105151 [Nitrosospira briensis]